MVMQLHTDFVRRSDGIANERELRAVPVAAFNVSIAKFSAFVKEYVGDTALELSWLAGFAPSMLACMHLFVEVRCGAGFDMCSPYPTFNAVNHPLSNHQEITPPRRRPL